MGPDVVFARDSVRIAWSGRSHIGVVGIGSFFPMRAKMPRGGRPCGARPDFIGTSEQIAADIVAAKKLGANELVIDVQFSPDIKTGDVLQRMQELYKMAQS